MTDEELKDYAEEIILSHARDVEYLSIFEMAEEYTGGEISDEDARKVDDLMTRATITVEFPDPDLFRVAVAAALGMGLPASDESIVAVAARAWRTTQGLVEGVLVDEGVTELPGAWTQDDGPQSAGVVAP